MAVAKRGEALPLATSGAHSCSASRLRADSQIKRLDRRERDAMHRDSTPFLTRSGPPRIPSIGLVRSWLWGSLFHRLLRCSRRRPERPPGEQQVRLPHIDVIAVARVVWMVFDAESRARYGPRGRCPSGR